MNEPAAAKAQIAKYLGIPNSPSMQSAAPRKVSTYSRGLLLLLACPLSRRRFLPRHLRNAQAAASFSFRKNWPATRARHLSQLAHKTTSAAPSSKEREVDWNDRILPVAGRMR